MLLMFFISSFLFNHILFNQINLVYLVFCISIITLDKSRMCFVFNFLLHFFISLVIVISTDFVLFYVHTMYQLDYLQNKRPY